MDEYSEMELNNMLRSNPHDLKDLWNHSGDLQKNHPWIFPQLLNVFKDDLLSTYTILKGTVPQVQGQFENEVGKAFQNFVGKTDRLDALWGTIAPAIQDKNVIRLIKAVSNDKKMPYMIWKRTNPRTQQNRMQEVLAELAPSHHFDAQIWANSSHRAQEQNIEVLMDYFHDETHDATEASIAWGGTSEHIQEERFAKVMELVAEQKQFFSNVWRSTSPQIQNQRIMDLVKEYPNNFPEICYGASAPVRLQQFWNMAKEIRNGHIKYHILDKKESDNFEANYVAFLQAYFGKDIEFDEKGEGVFPSDLKAIMFDSLPMEQAREMDKLREGIFKDWNSIKQYIKYKKASSIVNGGFEVKENSAAEVIAAFYAIHFAEPQNASQVELRNIPGADIFFSDTQYVENCAQLMERAYTLVEIMDSVPPVKAFPNVSVESEKDKSSVKIYHPQEKKGIFFGHKTKCCFRPCGVADNDGRSDPSFFKYCLTSKYGGILVHESEDGNTVFMGSPILVNGNMLMIHSYESKNHENTQISKELLIEFARKVIESSHGGIDAVMLGTLWTSDINISEMPVIGSFFRQYAEGEFAPYEHMYTNLDCDNCILAANVNGEVLSGNQLLQWYQTECDANEQVLKQKLNLHFGEPTGEYDFGEREVKSTIEIAHPGLVMQFLKKNEKLEEERQLLACVLERKKTQEKASLTPEESQKLEILEEKLSHFDQETVDSVSQMTLSQLREELEGNWDAQLKIDIDFIADYYHIDIEEALRTKITKEEVKVSNARPTNLQKKAISSLISQIKKKGDLEELSGIIDLEGKIKSGSLSQDELDKLSSLSIDTSTYQRAYLNDHASEESLEEQRRNSIIRQKMRSAMNDPLARETVVKETLFPEVTEEDIQNRALDVLRLSVINSLRTKIAQMRCGKTLDQLDPREQDVVLNEMRHYNINTLVRIATSGAYTEKEQKTYDELRDGEYQIDIGRLYSEISSDKDKLKRDVRSIKYEKLRASVIVESNKYKQMQVIMKSINPNCENSDIYSKMIFGNDWYVCFDENGEVQNAFIQDEARENPLVMDTYQKQLGIDETISNIGEAVKEVSPEEMHRMTNELKSSGIESNKGLAKDTPGPGGEE